jgi:hypothetical protein
LAHYVKGFWINIGMSIIIKKPGKARTFDTLSDSPDVRYACVDHTVRSINVKEFDEELYDLGGGWFQFHSDCEYPIRHLLAVIDYPESLMFMLRYSDLFSTVTTGEELKPLFSAIDYMLEINPLYGILQDPLYIATRLMQYNLNVD